MKFKNGSVITGDSGDNIGRGNRSTFYYVSGDLFVEVKRSTLDMKIVRQFKIHNEKYDPRQNLKIFLSKDSEGFYFWGCFTYTDEYEYRRRDRNKIIVTPLKSSGAENKFKTVDQAMKFKKHMDACGIWDFIPL